MSKERGEKPQPLDLKTVIENASEMTLRYGEHPPTLIIQGSQEGIVGQLYDVADTHEARVKQMFAVGFQVGQYESLGSLEQVFFISEGWMSVAENANLPTMPPSQDPKRKEVLAVSRMDIQDNETELALLEMIRDAAGNLTGLEPFKTTKEHSAHAESPLLAAFLVGFQAGRKNLPTDDYLTPQYVMLRI